MSIQKLEISTVETSNEDKIEKMRSDLNKLWNIARNNPSLVHPDHLKELWVYSLQEKGWKQAEAAEDCEAVDAFKKYVRKIYGTFWVVIPETENQLRKLSAYPYRNRLSNFFPFLRKEYNFLMYFIAVGIYILGYALYMFLLREFGALIAIITILSIMLIGFCLPIFIAKLSAKFCFLNFDKRYRYTYKYYIFNKDRQDSLHKKEHSRPAISRKARSWLYKHLSHLCELLSK